MHRLNMKLWILMFRSSAEEITVEDADELLAKFCWISDINMQPSDSIVSSSGGVGNRFRKLLTGVSYGGDLSPGRLR